MQHYVQHMRSSLRALTHRRTVKSDPYNCLISRRVPQNEGEGLTYVVKDNIATLDEATTCGSRLLENYHSPFQATVVSLLQENGMCLVGKSNMDEFGMGSSTIFSHYGVTLNPNFTDRRSAGGSSGGSAAAVASGISDFALGTDTGGSVRQPASYCGTVGFKPTYGRISRYGVIAYAQALDCVGLLSRKVSTLRPVFNLLNVYDDNDITSMPNDIRRKISNELKKRSPERSLRIGVPQEFLLEEMHDIVRNGLADVLQKLMSLGHTIVPVSIPSIEKSVSAYYTLVSAEAASNLARFDGKAFGGVSDEEVSRHYKPQIANGVALIQQNRTVGLGMEVKRRILLGNYTLSSASGDNFFKATKLRETLIQELNDVFACPNFMTSSKEGLDGDVKSKCDVLIGPTAFGEAPTIEECEKKTDRGSVDEYLNDVFTIPASLAALPAISVPSATRNVGVQIIGQYGDDDMVLDVAEMVERIR